MTDYLIFFCGHVYHNRCASAKITTIEKDLVSMKDREVIKDVVILMTNLTLRSLDVTCLVSSSYVVTALLVFDQSEVKALPTSHCEHTNNVMHWTTVCVLCLLF